MTHQDRWILIDGACKWFKVNRFRRDEDGGITIFIILIFTTMVLVSGMAVDFMRHEMARADLQNALDRGVLAAANADQSLAQTEAQTKQLVIDYMKSRSYQSPVLDVSVSAPVVSGGKMVTASARYELNTYFLKMVGFTKMSVPATARAQSNASRVEVSLILDVSDSMSQASTFTNGTRLSDLKTAAKAFVDRVLNDDVRSRTAISIIPYSAQVNLSPEMAAAYNINRHHTYGNCVNFAPADYQSTSVSTTASMAQSQHFFDYYEVQRVRVRYIAYYRWERTRWGWRQRPVYDYRWENRYVGDNYLCPGSANQILAYSNNNTQLKTAIDNLDYEGWTAAYTGMKWGVALLDPSSRPLVSRLIGSHHVSNDFAGWPADYTDVNTRKIVILMTDGRNTRQKKVDASGYATQTPTHWNSNLVPSEWVQYEVNNDDDGLGDDYLHDICDAAKAKSNVIVYTIGFELETSAHAETVLKGCASSSATHYNVDSLNVNEAFQNIAENIKKLRLTL